jgi:NADH-quinone oxidoreductase subunit J
MFDQSLLLGATAPDITTFVVGTIMVLGGAIGVIALRNPVHAALSLVVTLFGIAVLFVAQEAHFMAAVQVIVYAGAIVILFLFVIMLLGVDRVEPLKREPMRAQRPLAILFSLALVGLVAGLARWGWEATGAMSQGGVLSGSQPDIEKIADSVFTDYLFPFEATSLLLVIAVVGAVVLSQRSKELPADDESETPSAVQPGDGNASEEPVSESDEPEVRS